MGSFLGRRTGLVGVAILIFAGCSSPATQAPDSSALESFKQETNQRLDEITQELDGLSRATRRERLIELADEEGGVVDVYGVVNLEEMGPLIEQFESDTGITVNYFRAGSGDVLQRMLEEARADFRGADAVINNGAEMEITSREGLLAPIDTPISDDITPEGVKDTWLWSFIDIFVPAWNSEHVPKGAEPTTWEEVLTGSPGGLAMEAGDVDWFATLVKDYFVAEEGMTEDEAVQLFKDAASGATIIDGHTLMTELLAAGEFDVAASPYLHRVRQLKGDGASLGWEPAVEPLVTRPEGVGVHATAERPASGLLWVEYYVTDAQHFMLQFDLQPANTTVEGGGLPEEYSSIQVNVDAVIDEFDKWSDLYDEVVRQSGEEVVEE